MVLLIDTQWAMTQIFHGISMNFSRTKINILEVPQKRVKIGRRVLLREVTEKI